jgi:fructose-1,6-bisphosphatase/inositol monophosphatase family enzyme
LPLALRCAGAAGAVIAKAHAERAETAVDAIVKGVHGYDQVTVTDEECEQLIFTMIRGDARCEAHAFVGEEGCAAPDSSMATLPFSDITWVCDPLDGTKNFVKGLEHVAVCVGIAAHGKSRVGVVHCPLLSEVFFAVEGHGAYVAALDARDPNATNALATAMETLATRLGDGSADSAARLGALGVRRLDRRAEADSLPLIKSMVSTNVGHYRYGNFVQVTTNSIGALVSAALGLRMLGSCAIGMCHVAAARCDAYYERNVGGPWDVSAASVVVREAGGAIRDCSGGAFVLRPGKQRILAAASTALAEELSGVLAPIEAAVVGALEPEAERRARWERAPVHALLCPSPDLALDARSFLRTLTRLDLRGALGARSALPASIGGCSALTLLDVGNNALEALPSTLAQCPRLKVLFATANKLGAASGRGIAVCARMPALTMLSIKENGFVVLDAASLLPPQLEWLIATDNSIAAMPGLGSMHALRKLMLSHNALSSAALRDAGLAAPGACASLEMIRVANNAIEALPEGLLRHPKLAWLAVGGNPCAAAAAAAAAAGCEESGTSQRLGPVVDWSEVAIDAGTELGAGTSGAVVACAWRGRPGALKMWPTGGTFSDGSASDEWRLNRAVGSHPALVAPIAFVAPPSAPGLGIVMERLANAKPLGPPPTFATVTRDGPVVDAATHAFDAAEGVEFVASVARAVCSALRYLHEERGIVHGDVYAHNVLVSQGGVVKLGDLGAAANYARGGGNHVEKCEARAFGWLLDDMLRWAGASSGSATAGEGGDDSVWRPYIDLVALATAEDVDAVPTFHEIEKRLNRASQPSL